jgi:cytochrome c-type biogenesis protein CcmH
MRDRLVALTALLLLAAAAPAGAAENDSSPPLARPAETPQARASLTDIEDEVMCPICGTPLGLAQAPQADRERAFIRRLIAQGKTKEEIKDELVDEFGPEVLATPEPEGFDLAAWIVPGAAILVAGIAIAVGARRWRRRGASAAETERPELDPVERERLSSDLARYDL